jgi:hypothetical protein
MKKAIVIISMSALMLFSVVSLSRAQDQPQPKKDTVNMDTNAKPEFYYPVEDEDASGKSGLPVVAIVAGIVIVIGGAVVFVLKKKK